MTVTLGYRGRFAAAVALAAALVVPGSAGSAVATEAPSAKACHDVIDGGGSLERKAVAVSGVPTPLPTDDVAAAFRFVLAGPSCADSLYEVRFYSDAGQLLEMPSKLFYGDGERSAYEFLFDIDGYTDDESADGRCIGVDVVTRAKNGRVMDAAPDGAFRDLDAFADICERSGGATTSWR